MRNTYILYFIEVSEVEKLSSVLFQHILIARL